MALIHYLEMVLVQRVLKVNHALFQTYLRKIVLQELSNLLIILISFVNLLISIKQRKFSGLTRYKIVQKVNSRLLVQ